MTVTAEPLNDATEIVAGALLEGPTKSQAAPDRPFVTIAPDRLSAKFIVPATGSVAVSWRIIHKKNPARVTVLVSAP